jgi:hypothetical protein
VGVVIKKICGDVIAQKPMTLFKQVAHHMMAFFEMKSSYPSDFLKNIAIVNFFYWFSIANHLEILFICIRQYFSNESSHNIVISCINEFYNDKFLEKMLFFF